MNESETRAELIDPKLREDGWDGKLNPEVKVHREYNITAGKIRASGGREKALKADYVLSYKGRKLAVVEAKSDELPASEGLAQAKDYAEKLQLDHTYATNGLEIYHVNMDTAKEGKVENYYSPDELWSLTFPIKNDWQDNFDAIPFETKGGSMPGRFYQDIAVERALDAIAKKDNRILLTLATGVGKTHIAFQIAWKLFQSRWNIHFDGKRRPRILFLADRNILANQAYNAFSSFPEDAMVRIKPSEIKKKGAVPTNGSIFFTIFQTFMSGADAEGNPVPYFGEYPKDFFDLIFIDECHRGGANDEGTWRAILEYFSPAVQIGLTATPKRKENVDTYKYFGKPVFIYSLKEGINDGFLTPFKMKRVETSLDEYTYQPDDKVEGDIDEGRTYVEKDFNRIIEIKAREENRVRIFMDLIDQSEKTLVFCATQEHAAAIRDLINQYKKSTEPNYCVRVTSNDGDLGDQYLKTFQDNERSIPTILTTSQKLSTGVDARNIRNIILLRPVTNIIEFKQIVGRGTRLFEGKNFFTIYDFVNASERFRDPDWDGEPEDPEVINKRGPKDKYTIDEEEREHEHVEDGSINDYVQKPKIKIQLANGKEFEITHTVTSTFIGPDGRPMTVQEFLNCLYDEIPKLFTDEEELRKIWSSPITRKTLLLQLEEAGFGSDDLKNLQKIIDAEKSDLFDVLEFIAFSGKPISRIDRVNQARQSILFTLAPAQKEFIEFVLNRYIETGVEELDQEKLPDLLQLKYNEVSPAVTTRLGGIPVIRDLFVGFQKELYGARITI